MRLVLLLAALAAAPALAQSVTYRPLDIGNEWTYLRSTNASGSCSADTPRAYVQARVLRDTTVDGAAARVIGCDTYALDGAFSQSATIAAPVAFGTATTVVGSDNTCRTLFGGSSPVTTTNIPNPVPIGGIEYTMGSVAYRPFPFPRGATVHSYGDRVGLTSYTSSDSGSPGNPGSCTNSRIALVHAVIGGEMFGVQPVSGETDAPAAEARTLRAFPSPAASVVNLASDVRASVEVYNAIGQRVAQIEVVPGASARLDVSAWPAGVYVARSAEARTVRFVVAR